MSTTKIDAASIAPVKVNIYDQTYNLRSGGDSEYVRQLAEFVDERMRVISSHMQIVDYGKVAVLAALNIADELHRLKLAAELEQSTNVSENSEPLRSADRAEQSQVFNSNVENKDPESWSYKDIFESIPTKRDVTERMSQQVTARLRQRKIANEINIAADGPGVEE